VHVLDERGNRTTSYRLHQASILDVTVDEKTEFISTASMDGLVVVRSVAGSETYSFDYKRPMRTVSLEPNFGSKSTRALVCGGMAGTLSLQEKGWFGHTAKDLHVGEGPIWQVRWQDRLIAWANDFGVKIYDVHSQQRITFIDRPPDSPRADLFKCSLIWQDSSTLLIAWADHIKVARIRSRPKPTNDPSPHAPPFLVEITAVFQLETMISGVIPHITPNSNSPSRTPSVSSRRSSMVVPAPSLTSLLVLSYTPPDKYDEAATDTKRKRAERPELQIISRAGEELATDALSVSNYERWSCNDYHLVAFSSYLAPRCKSYPVQNYLVVSPQDIIVVKPRDRKDHVNWLLDHGKYEEAMSEVEQYPEDLQGEEEFDIGKIGARYIISLIDEGEFTKAASLTHKVGGKNTQMWRTWVYAFAERGQLHAIIPFVPTSNPQLDHLEYEMILGNLLNLDKKTFLTTLQEWPHSIYDIATVINFVKAALDASIGAPRRKKAEIVPDSMVPEPTSEDARLLMDCLATLYILNRQPGKALPYYLRLKRPDVFDLIRDNHLFTIVQDQTLLLVQFDAELREKGLKEKDEAIELLVDHIHSIPIGRVVHQLRSESEHLFRYLDALWKKDPALVTDFADLQLKLYAEHAPKRLIDFLRLSNSYNLEAAYEECQRRDFVDEMVFLLGEMGNFKKALTLIIERLGDVHRAIDFAKERKDKDLWEDLLKYSETRPAFIRGLLENVGPEIDPVLLIRRIKNGLEIPGLKEALIKILQDFQLQMSLLDGCQTILNGDSASFTRHLQRDQTKGFFLTAKTLCPICNRSLQDPPQQLVLLFLCRHVVHAHCIPGGDDLPSQPDRALRGVGMAGFGFNDAARRISNKIVFESSLRSHIPQGCPVCHAKSEGLRT
ncbi:vacuolar protein sorting-associated protein 41, partial [Flagelloscypha sp. PMI_526]